MINPRLAKPFFLSFILFFSFFFLTRLTKRGGYHPPGPCELENGTPIHLLGIARGFSLPVHTKISTPPQVRRHSDVTELKIADFQ